MKSKTWVGLFMGILILGIGVYMGLNYYANPLGYFTVQKGYDFYPREGYARSIKSQYLLEHPEIEGVILGGSKAGALSPARMEKYTGLKYYNFYLNVGNFQDYLRYARFLVENTGIRELTLHLSSFETLGEDRQYLGAQYKVPALLSGSRWKMLTEFLGYLMTDIKTLRGAIRERTDHWIPGKDILAIGMKSREEDLEEYWADPEKNVEKNTINKMENRLKHIFGSTNIGTTQAEFREDNLHCLREIVTLCKEHDVRLRVVIGASFLTERYTYECEEYWGYLADIVYLCDEVWDFSDFNEINLNPYNFFNARHYTLAVGDLMIDTMFGADSRNGFGRLVTKDNVLDYLQDRRAQYMELKKEYEQTGTVTLYDMDHESYVDLEAYGYGPGYEAYPAA